MGSWIMGQSKKSTDQRMDRFQFLHERWPARRDYKLPRTKTSNAYKTVQNSNSLFGVISVIARLNCSTIIHLCCCMRYLNM